MDVMTVGSGESASHFALHSVTLRALEYVVGVAIKDDFGFVLAVYDDAGRSQSAVICRGTPVRFTLDGPREPVDEQRFSQMLEHARNGRLELEIPAIDVDNMPIL